jgi:ABC-2 type transport system ATP-binding protein
MSVHLEQISKSYDQKQFAVGDITLTIPDHAVYCLLGKNGSGKSTLLNIIAGLIEPTSGQVLVNGRSYAEEAILIKKNMGVQSQFNQIIGELNAYDYLSWTGLLYGMPKEQIQLQRQNLLEFFFDEGEDLHQASRYYSSGMQKKLVLCATVMHKPDVLILDEPFANLDPVACSKLCDFINAYQSPRRTLLISSHDLLYVNKVATHIGVLDRTTLVFNDTAGRFTAGQSGAIDEELLKYLQTPVHNPSLIDSIV